MVPGAVREDTAVLEHPAVTADEGTPGLVTPGEMSPRVLVLLLVLSFGVVFSLTAGQLRDGFSWGTDPSKAPVPSTQQPVSAASPAPAPPPPPAPAVQPPPPAPAPQTQDYVPAPVDVPSDTQAPAAPVAPPAPPPAPPIPDILAPILPWLMPPPPPPPPPAP
ncbi:hypothetical protein ACIP5Y_09105 [Nocardia sp. NPDC088792]|uniref:hypothetical protein n=1 Tax=Nocardia sp. NPDC088792 TaxID=3364332 RepID=UPI003813F0B1